LVDSYLREDDGFHDEYEASIEPGELVIRFNLYEIALADGILERQLDAAKSELQAQLRVMRITPLRSKNRLRSAGTWITLIRLLDALSCKVPVAERIKIFSDRGDMLGRNAIRRAAERVRTATKRAREMCDGKYLEILALTDEEFDLTKRPEITARWQAENAPKEFVVGSKGGVR
jgi:hypothetical protein